jgi:DNA polymerase-1
MVLIECSNLIYRSYFGYPPMARYPDNHPVGVIHGCCSYFWYLARQQPGHAAIIFDKGRCKRRTALNPGYKAQRPPVADDLKQQMPLIRHAAVAFGFACVEEENIEADDLIATYARLAELAGQEVTIVSTDKDMFQLIRPGVCLFDPKKKIAIDAAHVVDKYGVSPEWMADLQALTGDTTDGIKGISGVGPKNATELLHKFGSLENVLRNGHRVLTAKGQVSKVGEAIIAEAENARLAKQQVLLDAHVPVTFNLNTFAYKGFDTAAALAFLDEWGLITLREEIAEAMQVAA